MASPSLLTKVLLFFNSRHTFKSTSSHKFGESPLRARFEEFANLLKRSTVAKDHKVLLSHLSKTTEDGFYGLHSSICEMDYRITDRLDGLLGKAPKGKRGGVGVEFEKAMKVRAEMVWPDEHFDANHVIKITDSQGKTRNTGNEIDILSCDPPYRLIEVSLSLREEDLTKFETKRGLVASEKVISEEAIKCEFWAIFIDPEEKDFLYKIAEQKNVKIVIGEELFSDLKS